MFFVNLALGGMIGTFARYFISSMLIKTLGSSFPYGTIAVNLLGCFVIGFLTIISENKMALSPNSRALLIVGFCGAFTTFSTFILETATLLRDGDTMKAFLNVLISVLAGFLVFRAGVLAAGSI